MGTLLLAWRKDPQIGSDWDNFGIELKHHILGMIDRDRSILRSRDRSIVLSGHLESIVFLKCTTVKHMAALEGV